MVYKHTVLCPFLYFQTEHTFKFVFPEQISQKALFDHVALPLVDDLLHGKNGNFKTCHIHIQQRTLVLFNPDTLAILCQVPSRIHQNPPPCSNTTVAVYLPLCISWFKESKHILIKAFGRCSECTDRKRWVIKHRFYSGPTNCYNSLERSVTWFSPNLCLWLFPPCESSNPS